MEPVLIVVLGVIGIALVLAIPSTLAKQDATTHHQTLTDMHQVKADAGRQIRELNRASRTRLTKVARPPAGSPRRRTS